MCFGESEDYLNKTWVKRGGIDWSKRWVDNKTKTFTNDFDYKVFETGNTESIVSEITLKYHSVVFERLKHFQMDLDQIPEEEGFLYEFRLT